MKTLIGISFILISFQALLQQADLVVENVDANVLYRGYNNRLLFRLKNINANDVRVTCNNCDTLYQKDSIDNKYVVVPGRGKSVVLTFSVKENDSSYSVLGKREYRVYNSPIPTLYLGPYKSGSTYEMDYIPSKLFLKYDPEISLLQSFRITKWEVQFNRKIFSGKGSNLHQDGLMEEIKSLKKSTKISITVTYSGSDGILRKTSGVFTYASKKVRLKTKGTPPAILIVD